MQKTLESDKLYKRKFGLNFLEFKKKLESGEIFPIYLIEGEDAYFRALAVNALKSNLVSEPSVNLVKFDGDGFKDASLFAEFLASLSAYPFMSRKRMTLVNNFYPVKEQLKRIADLVNEGVTCDSVLVIVNDKRDEGVKKLPNLCVVDCKKGDKITLSRWVKGTCEREGVQIDLETAGKLCEYCLLDMARISTETSKLVSYALDKRTITGEDLDLLIYRDSEHKIYTLTDFVAKRQVDKALEIVYDLLAKGENEQSLLISIYNYFRKLFHASISSLPEEQLLKALGVREEWQLKKIKTQASAFKITALKKAVDILQDADFKFKSGKSDLTSEFYLSLFKILLKK